MSRISNCKACHNLKMGIKTRISVPHTCFDADKIYREADQIKKDWDDSPVECTYCGWKGTAEMMQMYTYDDDYGTYFTCPECDSEIETPNI